MGSVSVREAIEKYSELIFCSFHGHIHETVDVNSGVFYTKLGKTISFAAGNRFNRRDLKFLLVDSSDVTKVQRISYP